MKFREENNQPGDPTCELFRWRNQGMTQALMHNKYLHPMTYSAEPYKQMLMLQDGSLCSGVAAPPRPYVFLVIVTRAHSMAFMEQCKLWHHKVLTFLTWGTISRE